MSKESQALFRLLEKEELMPDEYYLGNGYKNDLKLIIEALKRLEKFDKWVEKLIEDDDYAIQAQRWGQRKLELNELYDPQPFKTLDEWDYWSDEK